MLKNKIGNGGEVESFGWKNPYQKELKHFTRLGSWTLGIYNFLDSIKFYNGGDYGSFVSYCLSKLYKKIASDPIDYNYKLII